MQLYYQTSAGFTIENKEFLLGSHDFWHPMLGNSLDHDQQKKSILTKKKSFQVKKNYYIIFSILAS